MIKMTPTMEKILAFLATTDAKIRSCRGINLTYHYYIKDVDDDTIVKWFKMSGRGVRINGNTLSNLYQANLIRRVEHHYTESVYSITNEGKKAIADRLPDIVAEIESASSANKKLVILKTRPSSYYMKVKKYRFAALAEVVRETPKRVYVNIIDKVTSEYNIVEGYGNATYVDVNQVVASDVTREQWEQAKAAQAEHITWTDNLAVEEKDELAPIIKRYEDRRIQGAAQFEDAVAEIFKK